jgi:enoyl-CoA hydratase/carnithine racemase
MEKQLMTQPVLFQRLPSQHGADIGLVTLNSEKSLNSLTLDMVDLMLNQLLLWQQDDSIAAVFIQGAGEKAFCAGGDVQALYRSAVEQPGGPCEYAEAFFEREYRLDYLLHNFAKPTICWGHGIVMGGGLGIFAGCQYRIVTEKTRIAMPEVTIALFPDVGGSYFLNQMPGQCGRFLALTAASINANDSLYIGIGTHRIDHAEKQSVITALQAIDWRLATADEQLQQRLTIYQNSSGADFAAGNIAPHQALVDELCHGDDINAITERIANLDTDEKWLSRAKAGLANGSPLALKWIFRQLEQSKSQPLDAVFNSEILLATTIIRHTEFVEGVRALLIDKDQKPKWLYPQLGDVPDNLVDVFFEPPWPVNPLADLQITAAI